MFAKTNQVLLAMLTLGDFTADELSRFSRVLPATVRTAIARNRNLLETVGVEPTRKRGGQRTRYRLTDEGRSALKAQIDDTQAKLAPLSLVQSMAAKLPLSAEEKPAGLEIADDVLDRRLPAASDRGKKLQLLTIAENEVHGALRGLPKNPATAEKIRKAVQDRLAKIQTLQDQLANPEPACDTENLVPNVPGVGIQLWWWNVRPALVKRMANHLEHEATQVLISEVSNDPEAAVPPIDDSVVDAVVLLVDSNKPQEARQVVEGTIRILNELDKPLVVLDTGYDVKFRSDVLQAGVSTYFNDAAALNASDMKSIVGKMLDTSAYVRV